METQSTITPMTQHWQQLYERYRNGGNINEILKDKMITGLINNTIYKWNIPTEVRPDISQEILMAISKAFETYDPRRCDKVLPYVLMGVHQSVYKFLNYEIYDRTFCKENIRREVRHTQITPEVATTFEDTMIKMEDEANLITKIELLKDWLHSFIDGNAWEIYCYQWGVFDHEKLNNEETACRLNIPIEEVKRIKGNISSRITQRLQTKCFEERNKEMLKIIRG